jgi:hypothetical protein
MILFGTFRAAAQPDADRQIFDRCTKNAMRTGKTRMTDIARLFIGKPYAGGTLEGNDPERLVVDLRKFDCMTFVESVAAIFLCLRQQQQPSFDDFERILARIRYRGGTIDGYLSRLHYASDWIDDNVRKNILSGFIKKKLKNLGEEIFFNLNFMSGHSELYPYLKSHPQEVERIGQIEARLSKLSFRYIPKSKIARIDKFLDDGDIVFFVTLKPGLDFTHTGIVHRNNGVATFIHASQKMGRVIVNPESLSEYCLKSKTNAGIVVCEFN